MGKLWLTAREYELIAALKGLMANGCVEDDAYDRPWCYHCRAKLYTHEPHKDYCPYVAAGRLLAELGEPIEEPAK